MNPTPSSPPPKKSRPRPILTLLILVGGILFIVWGINTAWQAPQNRPNRATHPLNIPTFAPTEIPPVLFAALDPALAQALYQEQPHERQIELVVAEIPPIGVYLPRTGQQQFEFPTPTPLPTQTATPTIPATATVPPTLSLITATPIIATLSPDEISGTAIAIANINACAPSDLPVAGVLTQAFHQWHGGVDLGVYPNTPVLATHSGVVIFASWSDIGYGYLVIIQSGTFITYYAHNNSFNVSVGDQVGRGAIVAWSGSTGNSSGPHVHYEVRINDIPVDPLTFASRGYQTC